ncbi:MAG TPA: hypothetical protein VK610_06110, partial [Rhodothermales bacterium]|nr:hypothetical protein [Rhodothermales bacterium]
MTLIRKALGLSILLSANMIGVSYAQSGSVCPDYIIGERADYVSAIEQPIQGLLERLADCEISSWAAKTVLFRARVSDDPTLRPALRNVVDSWRASSPYLAGQALLALAVLGEEPDYFIDILEEAAEENDFEISNYMFGIFGYFANQADYNRLIRLKTQYPQVDLPMYNYWDFINERLGDNYVFDFE